MKKRILLLLIIYLAFISLGLPDSLLGSAWPSMYGDLHVPVHYAGIIFMIVASGTVISSLFSARLINQYGVAMVTTVSVLMTALALLGFSYSGNFILLCLLAIPLGLGAGSVDAALNNYVALFYEARHMNWLHSFWGVGATIGPMIMARYLAAGNYWSHGYNAVGWIQMGMFLILLVSIPLWRKKPVNHSTGAHVTKAPSYTTLLAIPGFKQALLVFFFYGTFETTFGLWGASYLVLVRNFEADDAAWLVSVYYGGITIGRVLSGFLTSRFNNRQLIILGQGIIILGLSVLFLPFEDTLLPAFFLIGLGCAPIFPNLLHETPQNFCEKHSQSVMGMQMASAYTGITLMPLLFGQLASWFGYSTLLWFLGIVLTLMVYLNMSLNKEVSFREGVS